MAQREAPAGAGLLLRVEPTCSGHHETDAPDPNRTWRTGLLDHLVGVGEERRQERDRTESE